MAGPEFGYPGSWARRQPDKLAYVFPARDTRASYAELDERSLRVANALSDRGIRPGDHVALLTGNEPITLDVAWGMQRSGLTYTAISTRATPAVAGYIARDCGARAIVAAPRYASLLDGADLSTTIKLAAGGAPSGWESYEDAVQAAGDAEDPSWTEGVDMLYSSGTTGLPKGIVRALGPRPLGEPDSATRLGAAHFAMDRDTVFLDPAPLYHAAPLRFALAQGRLGGTVVAPDGFDAEDFLALVEHHRVTVALCVTTMFVRLLRLPANVRRRYDLSSLRTVVHGSGPCPAEVKRAMIDWLGPVLVENYGATEGNGTTVATSAEWLARPGTVGRPTRGAVHIVGADGQEVAPGEAGLVYFEGGVPFSYHGDPAKTAAAHSPEGWSTLGDIGHLDDDGYLFLTDRATNLVITGGVNIYPRATEDVLALHPGVADVAAFGVPDDDLGEVVVAVVSPRDPAVAHNDLAAADLAAELLAYCRSRLPGYASPRRVHVADALPREPTGKLRIAELRAHYRTR